MFVLNAVLLRMALNLKHNRIIAYLDAVIRLYDIAGSVALARFCVSQRAYFLCDAGHDNILLS